MLLEVFMLDVVGIVCWSVEGGVVREGIDSLGGWVENNEGYMMVIVVVKIVYSFSVEVNDIVVVWVGCVFSCWWVNLICLVVGYVYICVEGI